MLRETPVFSGEEWTYYFTHWKEFSSKSLIDTSRFIVPTTLDWAMGECTPNLRVVFFKGLLDHASLVRPGPKIYKIIVDPLLTRRFSTSGAVFARDNPSFRTLRSSLQTNIDSVSDPSLRTLGLYRIPTRPVRTLFRLIPDTRVTSRFRLSVVEWWSVQGTGV